RFYSPCPAASELVEMTKNDIDMITHVHNDLRNTVAGGFTDLPRAARMLTIQWDVELAKVADAAVRLCHLNKLSCVSTPLFWWPGQNEALESSHCIQPSTILLRKQLESWTSQLSSALAQHLQDPSAGTSYFLQMVRDRCDRFGCAISRFTIGQMTHQLLKCIYSCTTLVVSHLNPVYEAAYSHAGEKCYSGRSQVYPQLCHPTESAEQCYGTDSAGHTPAPGYPGYPQYPPPPENHTYLGYLPLHLLYPLNQTVPTLPTLPTLPPFTLPPPQETLPPYPIDKKYKPPKIPRNPKMPPPGPSLSYPSPPPYFHPPPPFLTIFDIKILRTAGAIKRRARPRPRINSQELTSSEYDFSDYVHDVDPCDTCTTTPCKLKFYCF
ncbi:blast:Venom allergen 5, partial [Drosophila guanche]